MTVYSLDHMEENIAVCESDTGEVLHVRTIMLPDAAREGSLLSFADGRWTLLEAETERARREMFLLQESLFDES